VVQAMANFVAVAVALMPTKAVVKVSSSAAEFHPLEPQLWTVVQWLRHRSWALDT